MDIVGIIQAITFLDIVKLLMVTLLGVYAIFALLMMKQVSAMTRAVQMSDDYLIRILGVLNLGFAVLVLLLSMLIL